MSHGEPVVFRLRRHRLMLGIALIMVPVVLLIRGLAMVAAVAAGISLDFSDFVEVVLVALLTALAAGVGAMIGRGRNPGWVRMSADGLEFAAARHRATLLPWAGVAAGRLRFAGPFKQLVVTPADPRAVFFAQTAGRIPRLRKGAFVIDVGMMTPGPAALLAELNGRRAALIP